MKTEKTPDEPFFAVCEFYKNGTVFPVEMEMKSESEAQSRRNWMLVGASQNGDWRVIKTGKLAKLNVDLNGFTEKAQMEKRALIDREAAKLNII